MGWSPLTGINICKIGQAAIDNPNKLAVIMFAKPVFAPADIPIEDSTKQVTVVDPIPAPPIVLIASTILALFIHFLLCLSNFVIFDNIIKVPVVSKKSIYRNDKIAIYVIGLFHISTLAKPNQPDLTTSLKVPKSL